MAKIVFEYDVVCVKCGCELDIEIRDSTPPTQLAVKSCPVCFNSIKEVVREEVIKKITNSLKKLEV